MRQRNRIRSGPGSPPGHPILSATADVAGAVVSWVRYNESLFEENTSATVHETVESFDPGAVDWVHFSTPPNAEVLRWLHERLGLDPLALEDVHNGNQRTKFEHYEGHSFMAISVPVNRDGELTLEQFSLFLGPHWIISFWSADAPLVEPVLHRVRNGVGGRLRARKADYLFYCLVDLAVDSSFPVIEELREALESLEEELLSNPQEAAVQDIHSLRRKLALMRRLVLPGRAALERLLHEDDSPLNVATRRYARDVLDHQLRIGEHIDNLSELTRGLHELHLMGTSQRMNEVMRLLTIIATIFIPLTFVAGIYGMNFDPDVSPWNMPELRLRFGYPAVMLLFAAIGLGMVWMFRRRGWF
jgi:magnesium transporter